MSLVVHRVFTLKTNTSNKAQFTHDSFMTLLMTLFMTLLMTLLMTLHMPSITTLLTTDLSRGAKRAYADVLA